MNYLGHPVLGGQLLDQGSGPFLLLEPWQIPHAADDRETRWARKLFRLDPGPGAIHQRDRAGVAIPSHNGFPWHLDGRADISAFRAWLQARRGQLGAFWVPTWRRDLVLASVLGAAGTTLEIQSCGYTDHVFSSLARRHLALRVGSTLYLRRVLSAADAGATEDLELDLPLGVEAGLDTLVSYLTLARLASDAVELAWHTSEFVTAVADLVEVPDDPLQVPLTAAMLSQAGLSAFTAALTVNSNLTDNAWHTDSAAAGATLTADLGVPWPVRRAAVYAAAAGYAGSYAIRYSDDGSQWFTAHGGFVPANAGANEARWAEFGAHRWWQLYLENTPGAGVWLSELEFYTR